MPSGTFESCGVGGWEDDDVQSDDPKYRGRANEASLELSLVRSVIA